MEHAAQLTKEQSKEQRLFHLPIYNSAPTEGFFASSVCSSRGSKRRRRHFRLLIARFASALLVSMVFLLAAAHEAHGQSPGQSQSQSRALNESSRPASSSQALAASELAANATFVRAQSREGSRGADMLHDSPDIAPEGVSMSRNSLMGGDSLLQRQLREKAKQDSLESIKMHILLRLNLKKMPNMTRPEPVPQNILEQFYKNYNASLFSSNWVHNNKLNAVNTPRTGLYVPQEIVTEPPRSTQHNHKAKQASKSNSPPEMQGDDPNTYQEFQLIDAQQNVHSQRTADSAISNNDHDHVNDAADDDHDNADDDDDDNDDDEYMSILSHISSIYLFPEQPHMRHNRKADVLRFKFDTGYSDISYVTLHMYLRGLDWIAAHQPKVIEELPDYRSRDIVVTLYRAIRRANSTSYTHKAKIFEFRHKIPSGQGQWVNVDIKPLFGAGATTMDSPGPIRTLEIFVKGVEPWMRPLVVTTDNTSQNPLTVHIEVGSRKKHRRKRSVFMDCTESDHDMRCCRYPLKVNFTSFGWHFVVAPTSFDAYFCSGDCRVGYLEQYPHTHLAALTTSATPCCSPTKMSSLSLLYFDENHNLVLSVIPNMSVEGCSCS